MAVLGAVLLLLCSCVYAVIRASMTGNLKLCVHDLFCDGVAEHCVIWKRLECMQRDWRDSNNLLINIPEIQHEIYL